MTKYYYVYKITNLINGKIYIGKHCTTNLDDNYMGSGVVLHQAYQKYGLECFSKEVILFYTSEEELNRGEIYWIANYNSTDPNIGYNRTFGGDGGALTAETRQKISEACKGRPSPNKGVPMSEEQKLKISEANKGRIFSEEHKQKLSKPPTEETKQKISQSLKGKTPWNKGVPMSDEQKQKLSEALKGKPLSELTRRKMSESHKGKPGPRKGKPLSEAAKQKLKGRIPWNKGKKNLNK